MPNRLDYIIVIGKFSQIPEGLAHACISDENPDCEPKEVPNKHHGSEVSVKTTQVTTSSTGACLMMGTSQSQVIPSN